MDNRTGNLGDAIAISREGGKVVVVANGAKFSGRYLKYLTKKFLKKQNVPNSRIPSLHTLLFLSFVVVTGIGGLTLIVARLVESYFYAEGCV